jgi:hypothetical protein
LPLVAGSLDWYDLIGPAIILALVVGGGLNRTQAEETERRELQRRLRQED